VPFPSSIRTVALVALNVTPFTTTAFADGLRIVPVPEMPPPWVGGGVVDGGVVDGVDDELPPPPQPASTSAVARASAPAARVIVCFISFPLLQ
jgi:hypothetical protein